MASRGRSARALFTPAGELIHRVSLANPGPSVPNGEGGYTDTPVDLAPAVMWARIGAPSAADLESVGMGTVVAQKTELVTMRYHPQVTTQTVITFNGRRLAVTGVDNVQERNVELRLVCVEVVA
jgi:head-tail adaptor